MLKCRKCNRELNLDIDRPTYVAKAKGFYAVCPQCGSYIVLRGKLDFPGCKKVKIDKARGGEYEKKSSSLL